MFRFREVEKHFDSEKEVSRVQHTEYQRIKPETDITVLEAQDFFNNLFN